MNQANAFKTSPCDSCPLRKRPKVWGEGEKDGKICVVGQSPGAQEVKLKRPFVGRAGVRMDKAFEDMDLPRPSVWLTNTVKCFIPAKTEVPPAAITCCAAYLREELKGRRVVISIGRIAEAAVLAHCSSGQEGQADRPVLRSLVHPAAALYQAKYEVVLRAQCEHLREEVRVWRQAGLI